MQVRSAYRSYANKVALPARIRLGEILPGELQKERYSDGRTGAAKKEDRWFTPLSPCLLVFFRCGHARIEGFPGAWVGVFTMAFFLDWRVCRGLDRSLDPPPLFG